MNEITEAGAKGDKAKAGGGKGRAGGADSSVEAQVGRMLVRAIWAQDWSAANPDGKPEARKAAWKDARAAAIEKNHKLYSRAVAALMRSGVVISVPAAADMGDDA